MADVDATRGKVQRLLASEFGSVEVTEDGNFTMRSGSARLFVFVGEAFGGKHVVINARALVLRDVPQSADLYEYVATEGDYVFGNLSVSKSDDGTADVYFGQAILGDSLDPDELYSLVYAIGSTIDDVDDELQARFGGQRFHED